MDILRDTAQQAFFRCFRAATAVIARVDTLSNTIHQWLTSQGIQADQGLVFLLLLLALSVVLSIVVYVCTAACGLCRQQTGYPHNADSLRPAASRHSNDTDVFACLLCALDLRDDSLKAIELHTKGKRHIRNVEKAKSTHTPHKNSSVLKWLAMDAFKVLREQTHGQQHASFSHDDQVEPLKQQELSQNAKLQQIIRSAGRNVTVVHDPSLEVQHDAGGAGPEQPVQPSNYMTSFMHIEHGRNILSDLGVWVKFISASQEAQLIKSTQSILVAAQSKKARSSTLIPARGNDFASISVGCLYDVRKQELCASAKVEMMPSSFAEICKRIVANAEVLGLPADMSIDAATILVVEEGMHVSPHNFSATGLKHPVFMLVCAGDVDIVFGTEIKSASREGQFVPTGSSIRINKRSMLVFGDNMSKDTLHAVSCVPSRVVLAVFYGIPHELQVQAQAAGNLKSN